MWSLPTTTTGGSGTYFFWFRRKGSSGSFLATFKQFPPRQAAASFGIDRVLQSLSVNSQQD